MEINVVFNKFTKNIKSNVIHCLELICFVLTNFFIIDVLINRIT